MARNEPLALFQADRVLFLIAISVAILSRGPARSAVPAEPTLSVVRYSNSALGFAVDYPCEWQVTGLTAQQVDPLLRSWYVVEFVSDLYAYDEQAFGRYTVTVAVGQSIGGTLTETLAYSLSPIVPQFRDQIETRCCLEVGGEPAMEVVSFLARWGSRRVVVLHDDREYGLTFYPQIGLAGDPAPAVTARAAFEGFLRTFTFIPITEPPPPVTPTVTPAPTPMPTERATPTAMPAQARLPDTTWSVTWRGGAARPRHSFYDCDGETCPVRPSPTAP
jgi:hypothetical protein